MAYDEATAERVRQLLAGRGEFAEMKMMGAIRFMCHGNMCCGVTGSTLMIRVGKDGAEKLLAEEHVRPMEIAGRRMAGFVLINPAGFQTEAALVRWLQLSLNFVSTLPPKGNASEARS